MENKVHLEVKVLVGKDVYKGVACARSKHLVNRPLKTSTQAEEITCKKCSWVALVASGHQNSYLQAEYEGRLLVDNEELMDEPFTRG